MDMTEYQYGALVISLSTLGQADIRAVDSEKLETLGYLLEAAALNVKNTLHEQKVRDAHRRRIEDENEERI